VLASNAGQGQDAGGDPGPGRNTVADEGGGTSSGGASPGGPFFDFIGQLRRMADQLDPTRGGGTAVPQLPRLPTAATLPAPGALSAAQLAAMTSAVAAQRGSIEGLQAQLRAFDEQLAVLETILVPLAEWTRSWADLERTMMPPGAGG
jgi:hypothetical protein